MRKVILTLIILFSLSIFCSGQDTPPNYDPDRFSIYSSWSDIKQRLFSMNNQLRRGETDILYIIIGSENPNSKRIQRLRKKISSFLSTSLMLEKSRFRVVIHKSSSNEIEHWVIPKEEVLPKRN